MGLTVLLCGKRNGFAEVSQLAVQLKIRLRWMEG